MNKGLLFNYIVARPEDLRKVLRSVRKQLPVKFVTHEDKTTFFINVENLPKGNGIKRINYDQGLFKGFDLIEVSYYDTDEEQILNILKKQQVGMKFLGVSPGWLAEPTYLLWFKTSFPDVLEVLKLNKALDNSQEMGDNKNKEKL